MWERCKGRLKASTEVSLVFILLPVDVYSCMNHFKHMFFHRLNRYTSKTTNDLCIAHHYFYSMFQIDEELHNITEL